MSSTDETEADKRLRRVADCWDRTTVSRQNATAQGWLDSHYVASRRLNEKVSGNPRLNWLEGLLRRLEISSTGRWLSIGCGAAGQEIFAAKEGLFASLCGIDISSASIEAARQRATAEGVTNVTFLDGDFSTFEPPEEPYDVVLMNMALHHVEDLDGLMKRVRRSMGPESFFLIHEYVGPRQFQFSDRQLNIVRMLLAVLPPELRRTSTTGEVKERYDVRSVEFWDEVDPSESIRSDLIVPKLYQYFEVVDRIDYGGTILHLLLEHIVHNFDDSNGAHRSLLDLLGTFEDILIDLDVLVSDFTLMAMRKKSEPDTEVNPAPIAHVTPRPSRKELEFLRSELMTAQERLRSIEGSLGWRLAQAIRGLLGRRW